MKQHEFTDDEVKGIEDHTGRLMREAEERKNLYRAARKERIAAGKPEWDDCQSQDDLVCPRCGHWVPGWHDDRAAVSSCAPLWGTNAETDIHCRECGEVFHCEIRVTYNYSTTLLGDISKKVGERKDLPRI